MKKIFLSLLSVFMLTTMQLFADGPLPYTLRVLTFEDADAKEGFEALAYEENTDDFIDMYYGDFVNPWSKLITPNQSASNIMLYGSSGYGANEQIYTWYDGGNTFLYSEMHAADWGMGPSYAYWNGGHAISHYWSSNYGSSKYDPGYGGADYQLTIYHPGSSDLETSGGGHSGDNFCVHFGSQQGVTAGPEDLPGFEFKDGVARVIDHMFVAPTNYTLHGYLMGDGFAKPATLAAHEIWIEAWGWRVGDTDAPSANTLFKLVEDKDGNGVIDYDNDDVVKEWTKWDLSSLGAVWKVTFLLAGTDFAYSTSAANPGDLQHAAYFAYDDVAVRFPRDYYERTDLTAGNYGTICLPRNVAANDYEGAVFYKVVDRNAAGITLEEVTSLEKGKAYIFQATATTLRAYYTDGDDAVSEPATATTANIMQGSFLDNQVIPAGMWFIKNNQLWVSDGANDYVDANRAYLTDLTPMPSAPAPGRRRVNIPVHNDAPTSLNTVDTQDAQAVKMMQNGVIYIQKNGYLYNIQGQKAQ